MATAPQGKGEKSKKGPAFGGKGKPAGKGKGKKGC
jgi:hypothetical protein